MQATLQTATTRVDEAISIFGNCGISEYEEFHLLLANWREDIINSFNEKISGLITVSWNSKTGLSVNSYIMPTDLRTSKKLVVEFSISLTQAMLSTFRYAND